jgi:hypothetical protein
MESEAAARMQARYAKRAEPISLTPEELDFDRFPASIGIPALPVRAWIRFPGTAELVEGTASMWTSRAVRVDWQDGAVRRSTWVWASAVHRRGDSSRGRSLAERTAAQEKHP